MHGLLGGRGMQCKDVVELETASPDNRWVAVVYRRDCGATTLESTLIALRPAGRSVSSGKLEPFFSAEMDGGQIAVKWTANEALSVGIPVSAKIFRHEPFFKGTAISYEVGKGTTQTTAEPEKK
jgi:hypothetical protein